MSGSHAPPTVLARLRAAGHGGADLRSGDDTEPTWSPRPYLHPVTTPAGVVVTDTHPEDHRWHLGVSVTLQDVGGVNFWGGRTYVRDQGYTWRNDHGRVVAEDIAADPDRVEADLAWLGPDGRPRLHERRHLAVHDADASAWWLRIDFSLRNVTDEPIELGSPATNGRTGAGYGGLFWRLPPGPEPRVFTAAAAEGEDAVHGSYADWIAAHGRDDTGRRWTVALHARDDDTRSDPWFVRVAGYPGICSALAFERPVVLRPGAELARSFDALVADGWHDPVGDGQGGVG